MHLRLHLGTVTVQLSAAYDVTDVVVIGRNAGYWGDNWSFRNNGAPVSFRDASANELFSSHLTSPCAVYVSARYGGYAAGALKCSLSLENTS